MMAVTLYYHRDQAHRSVDLHPVIRHICRFWLWLNTGSSTREWVAVHRKHHAHCEKEGDPHSPRLFGLKKVAARRRRALSRRRARPRHAREVREGHAERLAREQSLPPPDAQLFRHRVARRRRPRAVRRAGHHHDRAAALEHAVHGRGHRQRPRAMRRATGTSRPTTRRRISGRSASLVAGEELHNNHHAFPTSARFSMRPHEVDMGWLHLKVLVWLGLAKIRRVADPPQLEQRRGPRPSSTSCGRSSCTACTCCGTTRTTSRCRCCAASSRASARTRTRCCAPRAGT